MIIQGDCIEVLKTLEPESVDCVVTDPPYGLSDHKPAEVEKCLAAWLAGEPYVPGGSRGGFMQAKWDAWVPGPEAWREVYRVMKPGAFIACFASTRTADLMSMALRLAGFRKHTDLLWAFGSGFPKATDLSKQIDKQAGAVREVVGPGPYAGRRPNAWGGDKNGNNAYEDYNADPMDLKTAPATQAAKEWDGYAYGLQALKPAVEPILFFQKPYEGKAVDSILKHNCGALDIDGSRVGTDGETPKGSGNGSLGKSWNSFKGNGGNETPPSGRWPANLILQADCPEVLACFPEKSTGGDGYKNSVFCGGKKTGGHGLGDSGSAARFFKQVEVTDEDRRIFYCAKPSKRERDAGCEEIEAKEKKPRNSCGDQSSYDCPDGAKRQGNKGTSLANNPHPTVKPLSLMKYLIGLISRPGDTVLDPFAGSGTTGCACIELKREFILIEKEPDYIQIIKARIAKASEQGRLF